MSFVAVAIGGSALIGAGAAVYSSGKQSEAANNALAFEKNQFNTSQANFKPYMDTGAGATYSLGKLLGVGQNGQSQTPDYSGFMNSPDYQFAQQQGNLGVIRQANAQGMNLSGGVLKDLDTFNSGLASQQYGNYYNRLMGLSQLGQASAAGSAASGTAGAANIGNTAQAVGQAQGSGAIGVSNSLNSGIQNSLLANYLGKSPSAYSTGNVTGNSNAVGAGTDAQYNAFGLQNGLTQADL